MALFKTLTDHIVSLDTETIPQKRKQQLLPLVDFIQNKVDANLEVPLLFICTHNSRRSHFAQFWAQVLACHLGFGRVGSFSGGTEVTALHPMVLETLRGYGFETHGLSQGDNPIYGINFSDRAHPLIGFSKKWQHPFNPRSGFAAVMTCSQADQGCPFVPGAELRVAMDFEDPKVFDQSAEQAEKYRECSLKIATELFFVLGSVR